MHEHIRAMYSIVLQRRRILISKSSDTVLCTVGIRYRILLILNAAHMSQQMDYTANKASVFPGRKFREKILSVMAVSNTFS